MSCTNFRNACPLPQGKFDADVFYKNLQELGAADVVGTCLVDVFWWVPGLKGTLLCMGVLIVSRYAGVS